MMPSYYLLLSSVSIFLYLLIDNLDGFVARKNNQCSEYGLWFDHTLDSFIGIEYVIHLTESVTNINHSFFYFLILLFFAIPNLAAVKKGSVDSKILFFGVDEVFAFICTFYFCRYFGIEYMNPFVTFFYENYYIIFFFGILYLFISNFKHINMIQLLFTIMNIIYLVYHRYQYNQPYFVAAMYTLQIGYVLLNEEKSDRIIKVSFIDKKDIMQYKKFLIILSTILLSVIQAFNVRSYVNILAISFMFLMMRLLYFFG
jgi:phosphatidylglycerophosphate synthase